MRFLAGNAKSRGTRAQNSVPAANRGRVGFKYGESVKNCNTALQAWEVPARGIDHLDAALNLPTASFHCFQNA